ncbi:MAG: hypothetical protein RDU89_02550 [bacterium]|nr:hypothetical protein [bacterium]
MPVFATDQDVYATIGALFEWGSQDPELGPKIAASGLTIRFVYHEPESEITVDARAVPPEGRHFTVLCGPAGLTPDVTMEMNADVAHTFWFGHMNLLTALARGQMKAVGPIQSILKLLPAIKPAYKKYPEIARAHGLPGEE